MREFIDVFVRWLKRLALGAILPAVIWLGHLLFEDFTVHATKFVAERVKVVDWLLPVLSWTVRHPASASVVMALFVFAASAMMATLQIKRHGLRPEQQPARPQMSGPFVLVDYVMDFNRHPEQKTRGLVLRNSAESPAINVHVSDIRAPTGRRATFETLPHLFKDAPQEVVANVEGMGPVFAHNLGEVLADHCEETGTDHGFNVFFQPLTIPLNVTYDDGSGRRFRSNYVIDYVPGHQTGVATFVSRELIVTCLRRFERSDLRRPTWL